MKNFFGLLLVVVVGIVGFKMVTGREIKLRPDARSAQEEQVHALQRRFERAVQSYAQLGRGGGVSGVDLSSEQDTSKEHVTAVKSELAAIRPQLTEAKAVAAADELDRQIGNFQQRAR